VASLWVLSRGPGARFIPSISPSTESSPRPLHIHSQFNNTTDVKRKTFSSPAKIRTPTAPRSPTTTTPTMLRSISLISAMSLLCATAQDVQPPFNCINNAPSLLSSCGGELEVAGQVVPLNVTTAATVR